MGPVLLCCCLVALSLARVAAQPSGVCPFKLTLARQQLCAVHRPSKLMLCSTAKAGATTVSAIIVGLANKTANYAAWRVSMGYPDRSMLSARINMYRREVLSLEDAHRLPEDKLELCKEQGWLCIVIVRNPADRLISSFLHIAVTRLGVSWRELLGVVDDAARVAVGNYSLRSHVDALGVTALSRTRRKGSDEHFLPQCSVALTCHPGMEQGRLKFITVDDVAGGLDAVDQEFRSGALGLRVIANTVTSSHWRSAHVAAARSAPALTPRRLAASELLPDVHTFASKLCGMPGGLKPRRSKNQSGRSLLAQPPAARGKRGRPHAYKCNVPPDAYAQLQAASPELWSQVRCLYHEDFKLYKRRVCEQPWLRARCPTCVAKACLCLSTCR
ncbi:hypothetical protein T492DRAFT_1107404 [Pavlovales sp. CCMP2436]|nr:hypothetical protein T492DRAFT_1107404 [Pavlovales sp. CCMP2436]